MINSYVIIGFFLMIGLMVLFVSSKTANGKTLRPKEFLRKSIQEPGVVIDVRSIGEHKATHLHDTDHNFDLLSGEFERKIEFLDLDKTYYIYCRTGKRSKKAVKIMKKLGFTNVYNVGGLPELVRAGARVA